MKSRVILYFLLIIISTLVSCTKEDTIDDINQNRPSNDSIPSTIEKIDAMSYCILENYTETDSIAYLFEDGSLMTISPDSLFGYTFQIGKMNETGEWSEESAIVIYADSLNYPCFVKTVNNYFTFDYKDNNNVLITVYDNNNNILNSKECSLDSILSTGSSTRGRTATTLDNALGIIGLINFAHNPRVSSYITSLCTAIGWGEGIKGNDIESAAWGLSSSTIALILNAASKLNWIAASVSIKVMLDEIYKKIWWGENPVFVVNSIESKPTTSQIIVNVSTNGECKNPKIDAECNPHSGGTYSMWKSQTISANNGNNNINFNKLLSSETYNLTLNLKSDGILGIFGQLEIFTQFTTGMPICHTGEATNITNESATIDFSFSNVDEGVSCYICFEKTGGQTATIPAKCIETKQSENFVGLIPNTEYTYYALATAPSNSGFISSQVYGEKKKFMTKEPNIDGVWQCVESDGTSYTVTIQDGECSWSNEMYSPGSVSWLGDGKLEFSILQDWYYEGWGRYSSVNFIGSINDLYNPTVISGNVEYHFGQMYLGTDYLTKSASFTMTK